ncbi:THAP domain-containing protein 1 [Odontomachus brunneus]|uniref:THAP domain-containing protein 1 n=1 Tax=Odontomachus brunneus TaxID=486640 RepID=UPI0013F1B8CA|nr:THAP domain-containing protein 1 [Odontomachus brunneus]
MVRYCYVCKQKQAKNEDLSLHKFPKNPVICAKWKKFCRLTEEDDISPLYICSSHFCPEDFRVHRSTLRAKRHVLNAEAIPLIRLTSRKWQSLFGKNKKYVKSKINLQAVSSNEKSESADVRPQNDNYLSVNVLANESQLQSEIPNDCDENMKPQINVPFRNLSVQIETVKVISPLQDNSFSQNVVRNVLNSANDLYVTPKRRYAEPRYISEIMTSDVKTPRRASRILKFVKNNDMKRREHIRKLQKINRNLMKRIKSLENVVSHLKNKQLISEGVADFLVQYCVN